MESLLGSIIQCKATCVTKYCIGITLLVGGEIPPFQHVHAMPNTNKIHDISIHVHAQ